MRIHYLQHVPHEGLGAIDAWARSRDHRISRTRLYLNEPLPEPGEIDWLIVMGGPMSVNDEAEHAWLAPEKQFIRACIGARLPVLGICLGSQLIANALGAEVGPNAYKEIGWFPVRRDAEAGGTAFGRLLPEEWDMFHWHGETFRLPEGAVPLLASTACQNQGFIHGDRVIALQCHPEMDLETAEAICDNAAEELEDGPYIQSRAEILGDEDRFDRLNASLPRLLGYLERLA